MIHRQPQRPRVVIESQRKGNPNNEQGRQQHLLVKTRERDARQINYKDKTFCGDDIRHNRADKESFFAFEDYPTSVTAVFEIKGSRDDRCAAAGRTSQFERSPNREANTWSVSFHSGPTIRTSIAGVQLIQPAICLCFFRCRTNMRA